MFILKIERAVNWLSEKCSLRQEVATKLACDSDNGYI